MIYPVSAEFTRLLRLPTATLTTKELVSLQGFALTFEALAAMNLNQYMPITDRVKRNLEGRGLSAKEVSSGLPAVEAMIDEYIDKYNLPHRLKRVHDALNSVIAEALNEAELIESLNRDQEDLKKIQEEIKKLEEKKSKGFDAVAFKERLKNSRNDLPEKTLEMLEINTKKIGAELRENGRIFTGKEKLSVAKRIAKSAEVDLKSLYTSNIAYLEKIHGEAQEITKSNLKKSYEDFVSSIFEGTNEINFPTLEKIKTSVKSLSNDFGFNFSEEDVRTRDVVIGHKTVSTSKWYKPWTWGDEKTVEITEKEEYVDLEDFWKKILVPIKGNFKSLEQDAIKEIENGHIQLVNRMIDIMNDEFDGKFKDFLDSVKNKIHTGKLKEEEIKRGKELLDDIVFIRSKLNVIISMEHQHV